MDKRYDHIKSEKEAQVLWKEKKIYAFNKDASKEIYSIDTPPPTVSGKLHIGHVFSYTHADIVARYKRMQGFNVFYPMGYDDNGLPTERYVEKKHKTKAHLMKRSEFIALCLKETHEVEKMFENLWKNLGFSVDWTKSYSTISDKVRNISQRDFLDLYDKGLIYRQYEPSLYCTTCRTSIAQAEIDNIEVSTTFNDLEFTTEDGEKLTIATTRPELLPACVAVFYHPDDARYQHLAGKFAVTPVFDKKVKILADPKVDMEKGSGLVMCCTFGDQTDIYWYKIHNLPFIQVVGFDGKWTKYGGPLEGLRVHEARKKVIELLQDAGKILQQKKVSHAVNAHERCKQEIEYLSLSQWFVKILENKKIFLDLADKITWKPSFMKSRYKDWVQNLNWDWCISRQRFYGIPFPVWHCSECEHIIVAQEKDLPVDPQEQAPPEKKCPKCSSEKIVPDTDVMDTWNISGLSPLINTNWPDESPDGLTIPMSLRPHAHDIIRTWTFYTIVKSYYHFNKIPWNDIMISGHVLAGKEKLSKSKGNQKMEPEVLLQTYPADVIRFWSAKGKLGTDTAFSENQLKIGQKLVTKLWNAFRFCSEHIQHYEKQKTPALDPLNKWLLHLLNKTVQDYTQQFNDYEYSHALDIVENFFWHNFCDNYLELIKDRFFNPDNYSEEIILGTRHTLYEVGHALLQLYAPFLPHITENLYQLFFKEKEGVESVHITTFDCDRYEYDFPSNVDIVQNILKLVGIVRKLKSEKSLSLKAELESLTVYADDQTLLDHLQKQEALLAGITKAKEITFCCEAGKETLLSGQQDNWKAEVQL